LNNDNVYNSTSRDNFASSTRIPLIEDQFKASEFRIELESKNKEIINLTKRNQELERIKIEMLADLEKYESDFQIAEKKFTSKENELNDNIKILEMEV